jgi:SLOG cluster4 family
MNEGTDTIEPQKSPASSLTSLPQRADEIFLEGPRSRFDEFVTLLRVMRDFLRGFRVLHFVGPCVTVFGSARVKIDNPHYELARKMGAAIAQLGFTVMTGAGPGIMEAANRGAREVGGRSVGCSIELPVEQSPNGYLDRCVTMHYFFVRKALLVKYSYAFVVMPGGGDHGNRLLTGIDRFCRQSRAARNDERVRFEFDLCDGFSRRHHRAHSTQSDQTFRAETCYACSTPSSVAWRTRLVERSLDVFVTAKTVGGIPVTAENARIIAADRGAGKFFNELLVAKLHAPQSYSFAAASRRFIAIPHLLSIAQ